MTRLPTWLSSLSACLVLVAAACGGPEKEANEYVDAVAATRTAICACDGYTLWPVLITGETFSSEEQCRAEFPPDSSARGCVEGLFADQVTDYSAQLDCFEAAERAFSSCLGGKTCTDTARASCLEDYQDDIDACPELPGDVQTDLSDCLN